MDPGRRRPAPAGPDPLNSAPATDADPFALDDFDAHALENLDAAALMDRVDTKFVAPIELLPGLLRAMRKQYSALEIGGRRSFRYRNDYLDDPGYGFYRAHHAGRASRTKVRGRRYLDAGSAYLEVKRRTNRGRTVKRRMPLPGSSDSVGFLEGSGVTNARALRAVQRGTYRRVALASEARGERLTIDRELAFADAATGREVRLGRWMVLELKQARRSRSSPFFGWARERGLRPCPFSKYCMGVYLTGPSGLPRNRFHGVARRVGMRRGAVAS